MLGLDGIRLRPLDPDRDGPALHAIWGDEDSCVYLAGPAFKTVEETVALMREWNKGFEETTWVIVEEAEGPALGRIGLFPRGRDIWEAACMVCPVGRGRNLAARALAIAIDEAFDKRGARRIFADVDPDNAASLRVFERLGFTREGVARANWKTHIGVRDSVILSLIDTDPRVWKA